MKVQDLITMTAKAEAEWLYLRDMLDTGETLISQSIDDVKKALDNLTVRGLTPSWKSEFDKIYKKYQ